VTFLALSNFLWSTLNDDGATTSASLGSEVDDVVGALDDIHIVLHNQNSVAAREETVEGGKGFSHVNFIAKVRKKILCYKFFYVFYQKTHYLLVHTREKAYFCP